MIDLGQLNSWVPHPDWQERQEVGFLHPGSHVKLPPLEIMLSDREVAW